MEKINFRPILFCLLVLIFALPSVLLAAAVDSGNWSVDGSTDNYTSWYDVTYIPNDNGAERPDGQLYYYQTGDSLFVAFVESLSIVDNSYGNQAIGWPGGKHKFDQLRGSDKAEFTFDYNDGSGDSGTTTFILDYFTVDNKDNPTTLDSGFTGDDKSASDATSVIGVLDAATSMEYNWTKYGSSNPEYFGKGKNSPTTIAALTDVVDYTNSNSPGTNINASEAYAVTDGADDWVFEIIYEFEIDLTTISQGASTADTIASINLAMTGGHLSPSKFGTKSYSTQLGSNHPGGSGGDTIPEPATMFLFGMGLIGLAGWGRKKIIK